MLKAKRAVLEKLDRMILHLTERRTAVGSSAQAQKEWEELNDTIWILRNARRQVVQGEES